MPPPEIDFRFAPKSGHTEAHAGLPVLTHLRHLSLGERNKTLRATHRRQHEDAPPHGRGVGSVFETWRQDCLTSHASHSQPRASCAFSRHIKTLATAPASPVTKSGGGLMPSVRFWASSNWEQAFPTRSSSTRSPDALIMLMNALRRLLADLPGPLPERDPAVTLSAIKSRQPAMISEGGGPAKAPPVPAHKAGLHVRRTA